jgi:hypothetical protein
MKENPTLSIYAQAVDELNQHTYDRGLYGKALCDCSGNESQARATYIKSRVEQIQKLNTEDRAARTVTENRQRIANWNGNRFTVRRRSSGPKGESIEYAFPRSFRSSYSSLVKMMVKWASL